MALHMVERLLEERIGLSADTIGSEAIAKAVQSRMQVCDLTSREAYAAYLLRSEAEWEELIESVIIPETWFFRNYRSFEFLRHYVKTEWMTGRANRKLRALSLPCSTGEEPYSMAITLLDAGLSEQAIHIDAVDVSAKSLEKARIGLYGAESFRGKDMDFSFRQSFFEAQGDKFQICSALRQIVHFQKGNLLAPAFLAKEDPYDVIFCRNVLIYLGTAAKNQTVSLLERLLSISGVMFVGHAERPAFAGAPFEWIQESGVFACRRATALQRASVSADRQHGKKGVKMPVPDVPQPQKPVAPYVSVFERRHSSQSNAAPAKEAAARIQAAVPTLDSKERRHAPDTMMQTLVRARQLADQGQLTEALALCDSVLKTEAAHVHAHFLKGLIYQALREDRLAEEWFSKAVYLDPNHEDALSYLAALAEFRGDPGKAARLRQRIERIRKKT